MSKKGITLVEVLIVISIVLVMTSILVPVFSHAKRSAKIASSTARLKQLSFALILYRDEWGGGSYGYAKDMGLPEYQQFVSHRFGLSKSALMSPCSSQLNPQSVGEFGYDYMYLPSGEEEWAAYALIRGESAYVMADLHCGNAPYVFSPYRRVFVLALNLNGAVDRINRYGDPTKLRWWNEL